MLKNEDQRIVVPRLSGTLILRAFQLLRAKVRHWADMHNIVKLRNYEEKMQAYILAKK